MNCETCEARKIDLQTGDEYCKELGALISPGAVIDKKTFEKLYAALWKLKDYEDAEVDPEQVLNLTERDTAKPPIDIENNYGFFVCPSCGNSIYASDDFESHRFCLNCGQRLEWED